MQAVAKDFSCSMFLFGIFNKNGRTRETENLKIVEEFHDVFVALTEMASVTFIKYHDNFLIAHALNTLVIVVTGDGTVQFLNSRNDNFAVPSKSIDEMTCVVGIVNGTRLKGFVFRLGLCVEVVAVNHEQHLIYSVNLTHQLCRLERSQGLSCACRVPNVAVLVGVLHTVENLFNCIELIRTQYHQTFVAFMQDDVFANHLAEIALVEEEIGEFAQVVERHVFLVGPIESELIAAIGIVGKIACVHTIADDKKLDVIKQAVERGLVVALYLVVGFFQFHPATLQFDLDQREAIDKNRHIITAFLATFNGDLVGDLIFILTPLLLVDELNPHTFTVFQLEVLEVA